MVHLLDSNEPWVETAQRMGLMPERLQDVWSLLDREAESGHIPGASVIIGRRGERIHYAAGYSVATEQERRRTARETIYDCASLTKVVVTLPLILMLVDRGQLSLEDPAALYIPELTGREAITIRHLLTHTSGFAAYVDLPAQGFSREELIGHVYGLQRSGVHPVGRSDREAVRMPAGRNGRTPCVRAFGDEGQSILSGGGA
jgi:CubicO group peptidase (beta-lactamase class C family)